MWILNAQLKESRRKGPLLGPLACCLTSFLSSRPCTAECVLPMSAMKACMRGEEHIYDGWSSQNGLQTILIKSGVGGWLAQFGWHSLRLLFCLLFIVVSPLFIAVSHYLLLCLHCWYCVFYPILVVDCCVCITILLICAHTLLFGFVQSLDNSLPQPRHPHGEI